MATIEDRLRAHSAHFLSMVSLIPPQYYAVKEEQHEEELSAAQSTRGTRYWHNKKSTAQPLKKSVKKTPRSHEKGTAEDDGGIVQDAATGRDLSVEHKKSLSLSDLQCRLRKKIAEVSAKRIAVNKDSESQNRRRRQRKEIERDPGKKQRKLEEKQKRREIVKKAKETRQKRVAVISGGAVPDSTEASSSPRLSFNRFEFGQSAKVGGKRKNYQALLGRAEAKQKRLQDLAGLDQEKGGEVVEREKWSKAVRMARGEKMKDDPKLLHKTMKRLEKKRQSHSKKWSERVKAEKQRVDARQKRRQQNIHERIEKIKAKKSRKLAKRRGMV